MYPDGGVDLPCSRMPELPEASTSARPANPQGPDAVRGHHSGCAAYQRVPLQECLGLRGCLLVAPGGAAPGPVHAGTPAAASGAERPAFLSRGAARLTEMLLSCGPVNQLTMRNRTHRVAAEPESACAAVPEPEPEIDPLAETMVVIDGAHIRTAHGYQSSRIDVTVGKIEVAGKPPRRFALAPKGADTPLDDVAPGASRTRMAALSRHHGAQRRRTGAITEGCLVTCAVAPLERYTAPWAFERWVERAAIQPGR